MFLYDGRRGLDSLDTVEEFDMLANGKLWEKNIVLGTNTHRLASLDQVGADEITKDITVSRGRRVKARQNGNRSSLARAVVTQEAGDL